MVHDSGVVGSLVVVEVVFVMARKKIVYNNLEKRASGVVLIKAFPQRWMNSLMVEDAWLTVDDCLV